MILADDQRAIVRALLEERADDFTSLVAVAGLDPAPTSASPTSGVWILARQI